ncbi:MAG: hypothetical protein JSR80_00150 [Verrucomicrobia bacterium]|nr:hypothetical protein [Verrucomicrobiota bacterium]
MIDSSNIFSSQFAPNYLSIDAHKKFNEWALQQTSDPNAQEAFHEKISRLERYLHTLSQRPPMSLSSRVLCPVPLVAVPLWPNNTKRPQCRSVEVLLCDASSHRPYLALQSTVDILTKVSSFWDEKIAIRGCEFSCHFLVQGTLDVASLSYNPSQSDVQTWLSFNFSASPKEISIEYAIFAEARSYASQFFLEVTNDDYVQAIKKIAEQPLNAMELQSRKTELLSSFDPSLKLVFISEEKKHVLAFEPLTGEPIVYLCAEDLPEGSRVGIWAEEDKVLMRSYLEQEVNNATSSKCLEWHHNAWEACSKEEYETLERLPYKFRMLMFDPIPEQEQRSAMQKQKAIAEHVEHYYQISKMSLNNAYRREKERLAPPDGSELSEQPKKVESCGTLSRLAMIVGGAAIICLFNYSMDKLSRKIKSLIKSKPSLS